MDDQGKSQEKPKILVFAGSVRKESFNRRLAQAAAKACEQAGAEVTPLELRDYNLPLFDQDLESRDGLPTAAVALKKIFLAHQGLLIAAPEYNSSITPLLKNTIDWVSRTDRNQPEEKSLAAYLGKTAALVSASPGALGGLRGLVHLRSILSNIGVLVSADQFALGKANEAFDEQGKIKDPKQQAALEKVAKSLVFITSRLRQ